jgi:hypothetical protein
MKSMECLDKFCRRGRAAAVGVANVDGSFDLT